MTSSLLPASTTVIELGDSLAGSYCGRLLARLGAKVFKVEPSKGSSLRSTPPFLDSPGANVSAIFAALNAGKEVVTADIDTAAGRNRIEGLVRSHGDIVVMSGKQSHWVAHGLTSDRIRELASRAIVGRVTLFGDDGPYADFEGGELHAQALGGLMNMVGSPVREPLRLGGYQVQHSTGLAMLSGFALAFFHRERTGVGGSFATSVIETVGQIEWKSALAYQADGAVTTRGGGGAPAILRAKDGFLAFFYRPNDWEKVLSIMDDPRLNSDLFATQERRDRNRAQLLEVLNDCTSKMSKRDLYHKTQAGRMTTGYMATMGDLLESEQYRARDFFEEIDLGDLGVGRLPGAPWRVIGGTS